MPSAGGYSEEQDYSLCLELGLDKLLGFTIIHLNINWSCPVGLLCVQ